MLMGKEERRGVRSIFQPTFGFNGGLERSARTGFRGCRFGSLSQSLVSQLPVRLLTINCGQGEHKGRRRVSIGNTLTAEVSLDFIVPKGHSVKVVRLPSFVEGLDAGRYAVLSLRISEKRLIRPTATGIIPISVQPKSEPAAIVPAIRAECANRIASSHADEPDSIHHRPRHRNSRRRRDIRNRHSHTLHNR